METDLAPIFLAFAFDVSGSMGQLDEPRWWHDPARKWAPVVEATTAFFEDATLARVNASMVFFPAEEEACDAETYATPDVAMTELPSKAFREAFLAYEEEVGHPLEGGDWRGGTPTFAALRGAADSLVFLRESEPSAALAAVLVTDGLPQSCDEDLEDTVAAALELSQAGIPTYVIGIENPTSPPADHPPAWSDWGKCDGDGNGGGEEPCQAPDTLGALNQIASAGESGSAFLIDTSAPDATKQAFSAAIEEIRERAFSCSVAVPPHPQGQSFAPDAIDISVATEAGSERLAYDDVCSGDGSWRYQEGDVTKLELCPATCDRIVNLLDAKLEVRFLCGPRPIQ